MYKTLLTALIAVAAVPIAAAQDDFPWIQPDAFVHDFADLFGEHHRTRLESSARQARNIGGVPLYMVVVPTVAAHGGGDLQPDAYAQLLLDTFQARLDATASLTPEKTIVVLFVQETGQLRIALGDGWPADAYAQTRDILRSVHDDYFDRESYATGLVECSARLIDLIQADAAGGSGTAARYALAATGLAALIGGLAILLWWRRRANGNSTALPEAVLRQQDSQIVRRLKKGADPDSVDELGYTAATYAAGQGDVAVLRELAEFNADLGRATLQGETPLYAAAQHGQLEAVTFLLNHGVPIDPKTDHGETPLLVAAREGHVDIVRTLLEAGANVNQQDNRGWTALMIAMRENHADLINLLLNHHVDVNLAPKDGAGALTMAVKQEDEDLVRQLIERGADVHQTGRDGMSPLRIAVLRGNQPIARRLLNAGADVTAPFANKETPVECAEREGHTELAAYLRKRIKRLAACMDILEVVARGDHARIREIVVQVPNSVNVHSKKSRWTPLLIAVRAGQLEIAQTLLEHGADVHARGNEGKAAIAYAVDAGDLPMVKVLLEGGARIDDVDPSGASLRDYASARERQAIVEFIYAFTDQQAAGHALFLAVQEDDPPKALAILRERPRCVDARTRSERWTPLLHAARANHTAMVRLLLEYGAQVNLLNSRGMSPLMYAARNGNLELVRLLIRQGADARLRSREDHTACEYALDRGHSRIVMLLQEVEAQLAEMSRADLEDEPETVSDIETVDGTPPPEPEGGRARAQEIFQAVADNDLNRAREVLQSWPESVAFRHGPSDLTPLHVAIHGGFHAMAELLLDTGADANAQTRNCKTPLYLAVARADSGLAALLLKHGAQPWHTVQGQTPLHVAKAAGYDDIAELLAQAPAPRAE